MAVPGDAAGALQPGEQSNADRAQERSQQRATSAASESVELLRRLVQLGEIQDKAARAIFVEARKQTALLERIAKAIERAPAASSSNGAAPSSGAWTPPDASGVASDAELDHVRFGDPQVRDAKVPRWDGDVPVGQPFSACTPEFLDALADYLAWRSSLAPKAGRDGKPPDVAKHATFARYKAMDARRARGWAARLRAGFVPPERPADDDAAEEEEALP